MVDLTRDRGLVFLPGGEALAFDPARPLPVGRWLAPARVGRGAWQPFPPRPDRPDRLTTIERPVPPDAVAAVLEAPAGADPLPGAGEGGPAGAVPEDARPPTGSLPGRVAAGLTLGAGQFVAWLGKALHSPGLAKAGANLARRALERIPRLSERLLGAQEAALREVLRQLRSGDIEKALRRAPVAVPDPDQPARIGTSANLGYRDPRYSLLSLIGAAGGVATAWLGGGDVWNELAREYRRLAEEATRRGDYRRAAYLYGVLLRDLRAAANVLLAGGLFRDAAVLYRDRLNDPAAAAAAFDRAGDYDEAVRLYDRAGRYEAAAELLRRLGEEDRAVAYFTRAADALAGKGRWAAAGDVLRTRAGRTDLAAVYYTQGWDDRGTEAVACGERLLDEFLVAGAVPRVRKLVAEAERAFAPPRHRDAGRFFNYALSVADPFLPADERDALADRARLLFAEHVRGQSGGNRAGAVADELFGPGAVWAGPVVRDAGFAARRPARPRPAAPPPDPTTRLADGAVRAVAVARDTFDLVVATTTAVSLWRADGGQVVPVSATNALDVIGLAVTPDGRQVYVLYRGDGLLLRCFTADGPRTAPHGQIQLDDPPADAEFYLQPSPAARDGQSTVTLADGRGRLTFRGPYLLTVPSDEFLADGRATRLLITGAGCAWDWDDRFVRCLPLGNARTARRWVPPWTPGVPPGSSLAAPPLDWLTPAAGVLEVVGTDHEGVLHWTEFDGRSSDGPQQQTLARPHPDRYAAACLVAPGLVAAVTGGNEVHWLRAAGNAFWEFAKPKRLAVPARAVFLAARPQANEVVVVFADGSSVCIPRG
jgi:hypothetical protein